MRLVNAVLALVFLAQSPGHAGSPTFKPMVEVIRPNYRYNMMAESLRAVDFNNFRFYIFADHETPDMIARLRNGKYQASSKDGLTHDWVGLNSVHFVDGGAEYAIVNLSWVSTGGSASDYGIVQVFALEDQHPVVVQQFEFNTRGCRAAGAKFDTPSKILTVKGVHALDHCCPTTLDVVTYGWDGSSFHQRSARSVPMAGQC